MLKVVLINPDIPWNAGNIGRSCVATGAELVFVGKLGFELSSKEIRRSGLDYWQHLKYSVHPDLESFLKTLGEDPSLIFLSTRGRASYWDAPYKDNSCLIFGSEGAGFPDWMYEKYADRLYRIPMWSDHVRSINLSTAAGIVLYEALRHTTGGRE
jgi:tRNA (cytidine/uridine-2'-O-)-methyltransferase